MRQIKNYPRAGVETSPPTEGTFSMVSGDVPSSGFLLTSNLPDSKLSFTNVSNLKENLQKQNKTKTHIVQEPDVESAILELRARNSQHTQPRHLDMRGNSLQFPTIV